MQKSDDAAPEGEPKWLKARLAQNERAVLRAIGVDSIEEGKALLANAKSTATALAEATAEVTDLRARLDDVARALGHMTDPLAIYLASTLTRKNK